MPLCPITMLFLFMGIFFQSVNYYDKQFLYKQKEHNYIQKKEQKKIPKMKRYLKMHCDTSKCTS